MSGTAGRKALVLGGGRGIGAATAQALARDGAEVMIGARSRAEINAVVQSIRAEGGACHGQTVDVTEAASVDRFVEFARAHMGDIDILVNSAGFFEPKDFVETSDADWTRNFEVNVLGTVRPCRAVLPGMANQGWGRVVNIASTAGKYGSYGQSAYNATKHAVVGLTRSLALEVADRGVTVNAVCPGFIHTRLLDHEGFREQHDIDSHEQLDEVLSRRVPIGRLVRADEVAAMCVYLCGPAAAAVTGQAYTIAGGMLLI
ncbi:SDR family NAD(P)-dependent oxidoreductase [Streptomyces sp. cmx-4-7]|uniref:SDR family NAD(P)-dependent oxidoreductase n=1 Tax=Streptomyces sp. cmx-4-7 TaxID=2790939 RepID=UPI003980CFC1